MLLLNLIRSIIYMTAILTWSLAMLSLDTSAADVAGFLLGVVLLTAGMTLADLLEEKILEKFNET